MNPEETNPILSAPEALRLALEALEHPASEIAEKNFKIIVMALEARHGENQKEVAGELQKLSKEIEAMGSLDSAMEFKQRSTEMMLKLGMERRRARQSGSGMPAPAVVAQTQNTVTETASPIAPPRPQAPAPRRPGDSTATRLVRHTHSSNTGLFQRLIFMVHTSTSYDSDLNLYTRTMGGKVDWALDSGGKRYRAVMFAQEPTILLVESDTLPRLLPIFAVTDLDKARQELSERGLVEKETLISPLGTCHIFKANVGISLGIIHQE
ncbi:MAG TPA: hypothetical protein PLC15_11025 [Candidatus Obscuribacter sp.]|nr:hypothetical protein [Candidatus Obscuribacter sp.]MBK9280024.1 hypothetical protein [Candidatus Obscuribacter sp.]MBL8084564.1 hypothetical protein [Candidatus Obscuribacter sp.]HNB15910.1 hypothetical protein [Candidatus Obscuribacter sp.]